MSQLSKVNTQYGSPMGRSSGGKPTGTITIFRVNLDNGGYDDGGAYWGIPNNLFCATDNEGYTEFFRAESADQAKEGLKLKYPGHAIAPDYDYHAFVMGYLGAAAWCGVLGEEGEEVGPDEYDATDFTEEAVKVAETDCIAFVDANREDLIGVDESQAGHLFYLNRNHHGSGFWDEGLGDAGNRLSKASHVYGSTDAYVTTDNKLNFN